MNILLFVSYCYFRHLKWRNVCFLSFQIYYFKFKVKENESNDDIKEAFRVFDRDGDGFISAEELGQVRLKELLINEFD